MVSSSHFVHIGISVIASDKSNNLDYSFGLILRSISSYDMFFALLPDFSFLCKVKVRSATVKLNLSSICHVSNFFIVCYLLAPLLRASTIKHTLYLVLRFSRSEFGKT